MSFASCGLSALRWVILDWFCALLARTFSHLFLFFAVMPRALPRFRLLFGGCERSGVEWNGLGFSWAARGLRPSLILDAESLFSAPILSSFALTLFFFVNLCFVGRETRLPLPIAASLNQNKFESVALRLSLHLRLAAGSAVA